MSAFDDEISRADLKMLGQALRQDWPIPPGIKRQLLQRAIDICDPDTPDGQKAKERSVLLALRTIALFGALTLKQQYLDLIREKWQAKQAGEAELLEAIEEAERIVNERRSDGAADRGPPGRVP